MKEPLTNRQQEVLSIIVDFIEAIGYPPTVRELGSLLGGVKNQAVVDHLKALERKGYIERHPFTSRAILVAK